MTRKGTWIWGRGVLWGLPSDPVYWHPETTEKSALWLGHPWTWRLRSGICLLPRDEQVAPPVVASPFMQLTCINPWRWATSSSPWLCWCQSMSPASPSSSSSTGGCPHFPPRAVLLDQSAPQRVRGKKLVQPPLKFLFQATLCSAGSLVKVKGEKATRDEVLICITAPHSTSFD